MAAIPPAPAPSTTVAASAPSHTTVPERPPAPAAKPKWLSYLTPIAVLLLAAALIITLTRNWNAWEGGRIDQVTRSEEHTSELQSHSDLVCRLLLANKNYIT